MRTGLLIGLLAAFPVLASAQHAERRNEAGAFVTYLFLDRIGSRDSGPGTSALGMGGRFIRHLSTHLDGEVEVAVDPNAGVSGARVLGSAGVKTGWRFSRVGVFARARPGFIWFARDPFGVPAPGTTPFRPRWAHSLDPSLDTGVTVELYSRRGVIFRVDTSDTIIRYHPRRVMSQLEPPRAVGNFTTHNRQWSIGAGTSFKTPCLLARQAQRWRLWRLSSRKRDSEGRATVGVVASFEFASVGFDDGPRDGQADPEAVWFRRDKWLEGVAVGAVRKARSGVPHRDLDVLGPRPRF